jgi:hypothetical protein
MQGKLLGTWVPTIVDMLGVLLHEIAKSLKH